MGRVVLLWRKCVYDIVVNVGDDIVIYVCDDIVYVCDDIGISIIILLSACVCR